MKIGLAADPMSGLGPTASAYWYRMYHLGEGLLRRGHDVIFFAACTSTTSARLIPPGDMVGWGEPEYQNIANAIRRSHEFDVLSITGFKGTFFADFAACRCSTTSPTGNTGRGPGACLHITAHRCSARTRGA